MRVGSLNTKVFMSDLAEQYYKAWVETFESESPPKKLLCTWHIDKSWRRKLKEMIHDKDQQITIYHHLRVLLEERDITSFNILLQKFMSMISKDHLVFYKYFSSEYVQRKDEWGYAYRAGSGINTNMYVESFHRVLKFVYLNNKQNRRMVSILLRISKDKAFQRMTKLEKGKCSHRL